MRIDTCVLEGGRTAPAPLHGPSMLSGAPDRIAEQLDELREAGVEHLVLEFLAEESADFEAQMEIFAERVRPQLA